MEDQYEPGFDDDVDIYQKYRLVYCPICNGTGMIHNGLCWKCNGFGEVYETVENE